MITAEDLHAFFVSICCNIEDYEEYVEETGNQISRDAWDFLSTNKERIKLFAHDYQLEYWDFSGQRLLSIMREVLIARDEGFSIIIWSGDADRVMIAGIMGFELIE